MSSISKQKLKNLLIGAAGIYSIYFVGSLIQQYIMKVPYTNIKTQQKEIFHNSNAFILIPSICAWLIGFICNYFKPPENAVVIPKKNLFSCSVLILLSALAMTRAIYLTNYPLVTLFKSCNILTVIIVAVFCSRVKDKTQKLQPYKILIGLAFTGGVLLYHFGSQKQRQQFQGSIQGVILLVISLVLDGFLPDFQAQIKTKFKPTPMEMFEQINKWKTYICIIYALGTLQIRYLFTFFFQHPLCLFHILCLGFTGAFGQIVVYWMISHFKQHIVPFIITTRKLLTVLISILYFHHESTLIQIIGIIIVFSLVLYDFYLQIKSTDKDKPKKQEARSKQQVSLSAFKTQQETQTLAPTMQQKIQPPEQNLPQSQEMKKEKDEIKQEPVTQQMAIEQKNGK